MIPISNVHTHCTWCDGKSTPREVIEAALLLEFTDLGFSSHSPAPFDPTCAGLADEQEYRRDIHHFKKEYEGKINILCGIEQEYYAPIDKNKYDYVIGSTHYLVVSENGYIAADGEQEEILRAKEEIYSGNGIEMARDFFQKSAAHIVRDKPDIVGHYDVISKYNQKNVLFDENDAKYKQVALEALDKIITTIKDYNGMIEVNTGALTRGLREVPYPAPFLLKHMAQRNVRAIITSDSHHAATLCSGFDIAEKCMVEAGYQTTTVLKNGLFIDMLL